MKCRITKRQHSFGRIKNVEFRNIELTFCEEFMHNVEILRSQNDAGLSARGHLVLAMAPKPSLVLYCSTVGHCMPSLKPCHSEFRNSTFFTVY